MRLVVEHMQDHQAEFLVVRIPVRILVVQEFRKIIVLQFGGEPVQVSVEPLPQRQVPFLVLERIEAARTASAS